jgi:chromosome segregation ATPase
MTDEELRRTMDFIVEQQARFAVHFQRLDEERVRDQPRLAELEKSFKRVVELIELNDSRLDAAESRLEMAQSRLDAAEAQLRISESRFTAVEELNGRLLELIQLNNSRLNTADSRITNCETRSKSLEDSFQRLVTLAEIAERRLEILESRADH